MTTVCNVCDGTEFTVNAGFYYCDNCGQRTTVLQEIEDQADGQFDEIPKKSHKIKQVATTQNSELTTWETYNYIIYGFVNELLCLGCKDELMLTTLQLWTAYLRKNEIAFYGKRDTDLPKFSFKFKHRDLRLVYSLPAKKRRYTSSVSSGSGKSFTLRQSKLALAKKRRTLASTQYEDYMSSQKTDITSVGINLSQVSSTGPSSENSDGTIRLKYSRRTRKKAKDKMTRAHLNEHQTDVGRKLKCHDYKDKEAIGRSFVYSILWLALNQIDDSVQISDLIRYAKESHIKLNNVSSFLPPNINSKQAVNNFRKSSNDALTHFAIRTKAYTIARVINVRHIKKPNLSMLCERYVKDLCLPAAIGEMIQNLLVFHPPVMKTKNSSALTRAVPNFEGRAMAYIIFVLKLFFGLDDKREYEISASAQCINSKLGENDSKHSELFVWSEWVEYIDMRNVILAQCHYPTAMQIDPNGKMHTDMYIDFLKKSNEDNMCNEQYRKVEMENIRMIFDQVVQLHQQNNTSRKPSCHFSPSPTPFYSYFEQISLDRSIKSKIYIPDYMNVNHDARDILPFLHPKKLKQTFREYNYSLQVKEIGHSTDVEYANITFDNAKVTASVQFSFDVTRQQWIELMKLRDEKHRKSTKRKQEKESKDIKQKVNAHLMNLQQKQHVVAENRKMASTANTLITINANASARTISENHSISDVSSYQYFDEEEKDIVDDMLLHEPRRDLDKQPNILDYCSSDESNDDESADQSNPSTSENTLDFVISNFDYWISMQNIYYITNASFDEAVLQLPQSFQWLLKQCALQIHMHVKDLYIELLAIENQYRYILKPIFKMTNCIKYRNVSTDKLDAQTLNAVKLLKRIW